jgi:hypothetical protein
MLLYPQWLPLSKRAASGSVSKCHGAGTLEKVIFNILKVKTTLPDPCGPSFSSGTIEHLKAC